MGYNNIYFFYPICFHTLGVIHRAYMNNAQVVANSSQRGQEETYNLSQEYTRYRTSNGILSE
jgi:hypothetical protein